MVFTESAKVLPVDELRDAINEECSNPTIDRLMFIEAKSQNSTETSGKVFPCYIKAWGMDPNENVKINPVVKFWMTIVQSAAGTFSMVEVVVPSTELGITKRIWDKPPTKALRDETPWLPEVEGGTQ